MWGRIKEAARKGGGVPKKRVVVALADGSSVEWLPNGLVRTIREPVLPTWINEGKDIT